MFVMKLGTSSLVCRLLVATVQDKRYSYSGRLTGNHMWSVVWN